jgi:hypothetical protein
VAIDRIALAPNATQCDAVQLRANFGIDRGHAYDLLRDGLIKSINMRRRGMQRGKRLFDVASVRAFLASQTDEMSPIFANSPKGLKMREATRQSRANAGNKKIHKKSGSP